MPDMLETNESFIDKTRGPQLSVVHFAADFVQQCTQVDDVLDALSKHPDYAKVSFLKCDAEKLPKISLKYNIEAVPTCIFIKSGNLIDRVDGVDASSISRKVKELAISAGSGDVPFEEHLKALINKGKITLFMKGDRNTPRCGFSRQTIEILNNTGLPYETFDILSDEAVRQGLKTYSDWPTYPQLYVNGDLIGGLDIIKEIQAAGELDMTLNPKI